MDHPIQKDEIGGFQAIYSRNSSMHKNQFVV